MAGRRLQGFSVMQPNDATETAEARLANAVIAMDVSPPTATVRDVQLAIQKQFEGRALPLSITRFRSDFVIQFATPDERDLVTSSEILYGEGFDALLVRWSNRYGAQTVNWETAVAIDIDGFPPHTFHPSALGPLLERHCSIQAHNFSESRGICRVDAYALSKDSVPRSGEIGLQYPTPHGVTNMVFPVTMVTYNYSEAPKFVQEEIHPNPADLYPADSIASFDTAEEFGYDREVLQEAYAWQHRANARLERRGYRGYASDSGSSSNSVSSDEPFYLPRDYSPARSFELDRSWHLY